MSLPELRKRLITAIPKIPVPDKFENHVSVPIRPLWVGKSPRPSVNAATGCAPHRWAHSKLRATPYRRWSLVNSVLVCGRTKSSAAAVSGVRTAGRPLRRGAPKSAESLSLWAGVLFAGGFDPPCPFWPRSVASENQRCGRYDVLEKTHGLARNGQRRAVRNIQKVPKSATLPGRNRSRNPQSGRYFCVAGSY